MKMVTKFIAANGTQMGASTQAFCKYVAAHSKLSAGFLNFVVRRVIAAGVKNGMLTKSGSGFKLKKAAKGTRRARKASKQGARRRKASKLP
ncbi:hypothetical protein DPMN_131208 [Dreissena polymorpha]|uniref:H15 domain-containing protein n=1 Tax=Dreissena polymorpha TaxID=45954 RepID=A0A9D4H967_DREPO|nr:hypothetical protein DPMN_131208 [Dreissena polymorpha]